MKNQQIFEAAKKLADAFQEMSTVWSLNEFECDKIFAGNYPFNVDIYQLSSDVHSWFEKTTDIINNQEDQEKAAIENTSVRHCRLKNTQEHSTVSELTLVGHPTVKVLWINEATVKAYDIDSPKGTTQPLWETDNIINLTIKLGTTVVKHVMKEMIDFCREFEIECKFNAAGSTWEHRMKYHNDKIALDTIEGPKVISSTIHNTGGNCMVSFIDVANCGKVKQLSMDENGINANSIRYEEDDDDCQSPVYVFDKYTELAAKYGEPFADSVMQILMHYCRKYKVQSAIGDGKWADEFEEMNMLVNANGEYQEDIARYLTHLREVSEHLVETIDNDGYQERVHDINITIDGQKFVVPGNVDSYRLFRKYLIEEYNES